VTPLTIPSGLVIWPRERLLWRDARIAYRARRGSQAARLHGKLVAMTARVVTPAGVVFESGTEEFDLFLMQLPPRVMFEMFDCLRLIFPRINAVDLAY
jgi:hypothetical protein